MVSDEERLLGLTPEEDIQNVMQRIEGNIQKYMVKKDIQIRTGWTTSQRIPFMPRPVSVLPNRQSLSKEYASLLSGRVNDPVMQLKVINYAEVLLQDHTWCDLSISTTSGSIADLKVICCLPEHGQAFVNWWHGREIPSFLYK